MYVLGLDVGYSALKMAGGDAGSSPRAMVRPSGAAPAARLGEQLGRGTGSEGPVMVEVGGQPWAAALAPSRLEGWQRPLHAGYTRSPVYAALVQAALVLCGRRRVDRLVTGLPVTQATDAPLKAALREALVGMHRTPAGAVEVVEVDILAQPVGAFLDWAFDADTDAELLTGLRAGTVVVLDVGFYSVDWSVIVARELRRGASGTSLEAMSVLVEAVAAAIARDHGGRPQPLAVEGALHAQQGEVFTLGRRVALPPYLDRAARAVCLPALEAMLQALRRETNNVDYLLLTGGGARLYGAGIAELFPGTRLQVARDPVLANARGFFRYGER